MLVFRKKNGFITEANKVFLFSEMIERKRAEVQEEVAAILRRNKNQTTDEIEVDPDQTQDVDGQEDSIDKENRSITPGRQLFLIKQIVQKQDTVLNFRIYPY